MRTFATPIAFKQALETRLATAARARGMHVNRFRQIFLFDRFLARVQIVEPNIVVKGGVVVELRVGRARTTKDVDLQWQGSSESILARLHDAVRLDLSDHLVFEARRDKDHPTLVAEGMEYPGQRFTVTTRLAGKPYGGTFGVDVALPEPMRGNVEVIAGPDVLSFCGIAPTRHRVYPIETHIAEKLHAYTLPRERLNSRVKDLPDIALLASVSTIDSTELRDAIEATFEHRRTHEIPVVLPAAPAHWADAYARLAGENELPWRDLPTLEIAARAFLDPVLAMGITGAWDASTWSWLVGTGSQPK